MNINEVSILGCGWLGLPLAKSLIQDGTCVKGSATSAEKVESLQTEGLESFLINVKKNQSFPSQFISGILIIALPPSKVDPEPLSSFLEFATQHGLKKIILISSTGIYLNSEKPISESDRPFVDRNSKLFQLEELTQKLNQVDVIILRMGGLFGYDRNPLRFMGSQKVTSNPEGVINFIHQDDAVRLIKAVINSEIQNGVFNCCADEHPTKIEFYTRLAREHFLEPPKFEDTSLGEFKIIDNSLIKKTLNFTFSNLYTTIFR